MHTYTVSTLADYQPLIAELLGGPADTTRVIALHGDLGAGKTTFVQQLGQVLGVTDPITSPTFTIMNRYETSHTVWHTLLHMDAYRIEEIAELTPLHFNELLTKPNTIFCIEWAELIADALPVYTTHLTLSTGVHEDRSVTITSHEEWQRTQ